MNKINMEYKCKSMKELNIIDRAFYFSNDLVNLSDFDSRNLKLYKKVHTDLTMFFLSYINLKKNNYLVNVRCTDYYSYSCIPLYLFINNIYGYLTFDGVYYYLCIDPMISSFKNVLMDIWESIIKIEDYLFGYVNNYYLITFKSYDKLELNKLMKFSMLCVSIRCVIKKNGLLYSQIYFDSGFLVVWNYVYKGIGFCFNFTNNSSSQTLNAFVP